MTKTTTPTELFEGRKKKGKQRTFIETSMIEGREKKGDKRGINNWEEGNCKNGSRIAVK